MQTFNGTFNTYGEMASVQAKPLDWRGKGVASRIDLYRSECFILGTRPNPTHPPLRQSLSRPLPWQGLCPNGSTLVRFRAYIGPNTFNGTFNTSRRFAALRSPYPAGTRGREVANG